MPTPSRIVFAHHCFINYPAHIIPNLRSSCRLNQKMIVLALSSAGQWIKHLLDITTHAAFRLTSRVEDRRGSIKPRFPSSSSNRTCGATASDFPTGFSSRHTLDGRSYRPWQHYSKFSEHSFRRIPTDASRSHLMPFNQKTSDAVVYIPFHRTIRNHRRAIAKVSAPTPQKRIQPVSYIRPCSLLTGS